MTDSEIHSLSGAYAVDALDDIERAQFERHLADCAACRDEVAGLREAAAELAHTVAVAPPAALRDRVLADIATVRPLPPETGRPSAVPARAESTPAKTSWARRPGLIVAAAAAVIALGVGAAVTHPWNSRSDNQNPIGQVMAAGDATTIRADLPTVPGASILVTRSASRNGVVMVTKGVPNPPSDKVYQAWLLEPGGRMVSAGLMPSVTDDRPVLLDPSVDARSATAMAITLEPAGGSPSPTQQPLVEVRFSRT